MQSPSPATRKQHLFAIAVALTLSFASASVFAGGWFGGNTVKGNGAVKKQDRAVPHFTGVELSLPAQVEIRLGTTESVTIETDDNILPLVQVTVEGGNLQLRPTKRNIDFNTRTFRIVVNAKEITDLGIGGSGSISADVLRTPRLHMGIGGGGSIDVKQVQSDSVEAAIGGSGNVKLGGAAKKFAVTIGGSGDVQARQLKANEVTVSIGGSGSATLWPVSTLQTSIAGSGDVNYYGDPKTTTTVVGSGSVKRLGAMPK